MSETWFDRLAIAIERDGRSLRAISQAANCGPNYLQQLMKDRKEPGVERFLKIVKALGTASALYVLTGVDLTRDDEEFFAVVLALKPEVRSEALGFFRALQAGEGGQAPRPSVVR